MKAYFLAAAALTIAAPVMAAQPEEQTLSQLVEDLRTGKTTSEDVTAAYINRINTLDETGPAINAVIALDPDAMKIARERDAEYKAGKWRGPLHGVPILVKDNIEVAGPLATTAGSLALKDNVTNRDAFIIAKLKAAGAIILGKTNLSEWANIRSDNSTSGWSAVGGLTQNPYRLDYNACGSSSGSGAAMAASFAAATIGTETDGSIVCPSSINGVVGFKPTLGLVSRNHIVPISHSQDTAGPITRTVMDAAFMLSAMAGTDPDDPATAEADSHKGDYNSGLSVDALKGMRIGVIHADNEDPLFDAALKKLEEGGAVLVPMEPKYDKEELGKAEFKVLLAELKADLGTYLSTLPKGSKVPSRSLADIIAFNKDHAQDELQHFGQETFLLADQEGGLDSPEYLKALKTSKELATKILNRMLVDVEIVVAQTNGPAWQTTLGKGDKFNPPSASTLPAVAGYPHLTVPMGLTTNGLPVGISFIGYQWADYRVLQAGYAYEQLAGQPPRPQFKNPGTQ